MNRPNGRCRRLEELIEDACGESPAASLDRVCSLLFYVINRSVFAFIRAAFVHDANCCILERRYGFVGRFLGLLGGVGGILGGLGALLGSSWGVLGWSWGVLGRSWALLGRSWAVLGEVLGGLGAILGRHVEQSNF